MEALMFALVGKLLVFVLVVIALAVVGFVALLRKVF